MTPTSYLAAGHPWLTAFLVGLCTGIILMMIAVALPKRRRRGDDDPTDSAGA